MGCIRIPKPRCENCSYYHLMPEQQLRYCAMGKELRIFSYKDPKIYVPIWCPRRKFPAEFRAYSYKSIVLGKSDLFHIDRRLALKVEGAMICSIQEFCTRIYQLGVNSLDLGVYDGDVLEFEDGFGPYYFSIYNNNIKRLFDFDGIALHGSR